jgi:hypothetical protein
MPQLRIEKGFTKGFSDFCLDTMAKAAQGQGERFNKAA